MSRLGYDIMYDMGHGGVSRDDINTSNHSYLDAEWGGGGNSTPPLRYNQSPIYNHTQFFLNCPLVRKTFGSDPLPRLDQINGPERYTATLNQNKANSTCVNGLAQVLTCARGPITTDGRADN
jgi:hypothetical protein